MSEPATTIAISPASGLTVAKIISDDLAHLRHEETDLFSAYAKERCRRDIEQREQDLMEVASRNRKAFTVIEGGRKDG